MAETSTFIKLDRNITRWRWYQNANTFRVFVHCLIAANIKDHDFENITVHRGELVTSYEKMAKALGLTVKQARTALAHLQKTGETALKRHSKFLVVSIINYDRYQGNGQSTGSQRADEWQAEGSQRALKGQQSKKEKKEKNDKNLPPISPRGGRASETSSFSTMDFFEAAVARAFGTDDQGFDADAL